MRRTAIGLLMTLAAGSVALAAGGASVQRQRVTSGGHTLELPLGLQASAAYLPDGNPLTQAKVELGRMLYFDTRLSKDDTVSCATCHDPSHGWAEPRKTSTGVGGKVGGRNAPTVLNRLFSKEQF